jgi:hypothetical protein
VFLVNPVKNFEVLLDDESPDLGALAHSGMAFREKIQVFSPLDNQLAQIARGYGIIQRNSAQHPLKIFSEGILENYFVVHSPILARSSSAVCP